MPVISYANAKGGAGKTTAALLLATEVAELGKTVTIFDADPQRWISTWADLPGRHKNIEVVSQVTPGTVTEQILDASRKSDYVIVDLEGTENLIVANALSVSDLVVIPIQGCTMDARGGAKILSLIAKLEKAVRHPIKHSVVLTRTNAAVTPRALKAVQQHLAAAGVDVMMTPIVERAAYRDMFEFGGGLADMVAKNEASLNKARDNASHYAAEVLEMAVVEPRRRWYDWFRKAS